VTGRAKVWWALVVAIATLGCTKLLQNRCDQTSDCNVALHETCDMPTKTCISPTGGAGGAAGAGGMAGAAGAKAGAGGAVGGAGGAVGGAGGAGGAKFTCATCGGSKPICDVDAGACRSCGQLPGSCSPDGGTPVCVSADAGVNPGMCVGCLADNNCQGATPICELGADAGPSRDTCRGCTGTSDCSQHSAMRPVCVTAANTAGGAQPGACVGCLADNNCQGATPICELGAGASRNTCRACTGTSDCTQHNAMTPVCVTAANAAGGAQPGTCVACVANGSCGGGKPICELTTTNAGATVNTCRACATDAECVGPGVCMADGHCALATEVIFVDETASCTGNDGSMSSPYCSLPTGVGQLAKARNVLVILGTVGERLSLATTGGTNPVIIGRKNAAGDAPVIAAANSAAISVSSDTVIIRDITLSGGITASGTRGLLASGTASVTLLRVIVNLGSGGPGVDAETGATLTMDECYVANNPVGGILVNGATATIQNTLIAANPSASGYGVQFNAPGMGTVFAFNTIVGYATACTSDLNHQVPLNYSIVLGPQPTNCTTATSVTTAPTFTTTTLTDPNPYHLTGHLPCPVTATAFPDHDIDGQPRTSSNLDCGADEFVQ
jgi:hypothetical protein